MPSTLATMISKLSGKNSGPKTPPRPRTPAEERALYIARKNIEKAFDAILVAIGIVAVLVVNVTFVGYLTPPGGVHPYWEDCYYSMFQGFIIANGFALVFSLAAIAVVTLGPYILTLRHQQEWRIPVVNVGLLHLCLSLSSLLLAFAFAGYVNANVGVPHLNCSNIACRAGGIACTQFVKPPDHFGEFSRGNKYSSPQDSNVAMPWTFALDGSFGLDAQIEKLNADIFYNSGQYNSSNRIACFDYGLLLNNSFAKVVLHPDDCSLARGCNTSFAPCFSLVSRHKASRWVAGVDFAAPPATDTTWCSADIANLGGGGGFLSLDWDTGAALLSEVLGVCLSHNLTYTAHYAGTRGNATTANDHWEETLQRTELHDANATTPLGDNFTACPELPEEYAAWAAANASSGELYRLLEAPAPGLNESAVTDEAGKHVDRLQRYVNILAGADGDSRRFTEEREGCPAVVLRPGPLRNALNYPELRYRCAPENNVLCDYGPPESRLAVPLAVEESGNYLTKSELALHSNAYAVAFEVTGGTFVGVTIMLIVAVLANVFSILYLVFSNLKSTLDNSLTSEESWRFSENKLRSTSIQ